MKIWTCDFKGCDEIAQWYRKKKGELVKLCSKHYASLDRMRWGRRVEESELDEDDIRYLEEKEQMKESEKKDPFEVRLYELADEWKVRVEDRQTGEKRSFAIKNSDYEGFDEIYHDLQRKGFSPKPSIDEYVKRLRNGVSSKTKS